MKKIYLLLLALSVVLFAVSCDFNSSFLDETVTTNLSEEAVFSDSAYTTAFLYDIYTSIGFDTEPNRWDGGVQTASTEAEPRTTSDITTDLQFATGTVNSVIVSGDAWTTSYSRIRKVNVFLHHVDNAPLTDKRKKIYKAEARFLRAWYYSILLKHYGGVPIVGDTIYQNGDEITAVRETYDDVLQYILSECDIAAQDLIIDPSGRDHGRVGAGACMALKSRLLLFAASPLMNGSNYAPSEYTELLGYANYDKERWKTAYEAAQDVISLGVYHLYVDNDEEMGRGFYRLFMAGDWDSDGAYSGTIFERMSDKGQGRERLWYPPSTGGSGQGGYPYQELIDAFGMANGKAITDPESGYDPLKPYSGRDPRFYNSVIYDQTKLKNGATPDVPTDIYLGNYMGVGEGQDAVHTGTPTGYYSKKQTHREITPNYFVGGPQARPLIRYAEILLNYAEAKNEYDGPTTEVYEALESIRERGGMDPFTLPAGLTQDEMREVIRNERQVELAFEGFWFWDVRRWMIAEETENRTMTGMEVIRNGNKSTDYNSFEVRKHVFRPSMYFFPIPYSEVAKSPELIQNPYY